ncbi:MAG: hypothetical protein A2539_04430 [Elusimicrobia bacterium RIFOXYD2_FULL_34_15]|nr:MAG: hypothetical protein A2539_04430 [Elusimicrobia bacterium RIFOXYD2_FULL_34_15]
MKLKICMLLERFHPVFGGTELQAQRLARSLINSGNDVFILTARLKKLNKYELLDNLPIYRTFSIGKGLLSSICFFISSFLFLFINRNKYEIIHVHLASSHAFSAILIKKLFKKRIILKFGGARSTGDIATSLSKPLGKLKLNILKKYFDIYIVPSKEVFDEIISEGFSIDKTLIIPNGVNTDIFKRVDLNEKINLRKVLGLPIDKQICIYVGRIEEGKGINLLLNIWKNVTENYVLLIIGSGSLLEKFKKSFQNKNIVFLGFKNNVNNYLQASDLFILPSFGEGLSNAILEAMSCGLVAVANKIPSNEEIIIDRDNGILINIDTIKDFPNLINQIFSNKEMFNKLSFSAVKTIENRFSINIVTNSYIKLYRNILSNYKQA